MEVLLQADKRMCTEIDVKVYESPSKMLKDKIGKFMDEMVGDQMEILNEVKKSDAVIIEKGKESIRKLGISGCLHMAPGYTRFSWPGPELL